MSLRGVSRLLVYVVTERLASRPATVALDDACLHGTCLAVSEALLHHDAIVILTEVYSQNDGNVINREDLLLLNRSAVW